MLRYQVNSDNRFNIRTMMLRQRRKPHGVTGGFLLGMGAPRIAEQKSRLTKYL